MKITINFFNMSNEFLKPIETFYKGYKFRSRLEARWAVFFDTIGIKWQYEVEGFTLSDGRHYLPDFKITTLNKLTCWIEIKPLDDPGDGKLQRFSLDHHAKYPEDFNTEFTVCSGDPFDVFGGGIELLKAWGCGQVGYTGRFVMCPRCAAINVVRVTSIYENELSFMCFPCDYATPGGSGNQIEIGVIANSTPHKGELIVDADDIKIYLSKIESACAKARSARFEHNN